jgi:gas vesicle protein
MMAFKGEISMFEEIIESGTGPFGLAAVALLLLPGGRKFLRNAAKEVVRVGMNVTERAKEMVSEVKEEAQDVIAEVKAERKEHAHAVKPNKAS